MTGYDVLLIEDNPADVHFFRMLLKQQRSRLGPLPVESVGTLAEAMAFLKSKQEPAVILLDLTLPDAVGLEGLIDLRQAAPHIPVIVLTGMRDSKLAGQALKAGAANYLTKESVTKANEIVVFWIETTIRLAEDQRVIDQLQQMQAGRLRNLIIACSNCERWLDQASGEWLPPAKWVERHSVYLSHTICVTCGQTLYGDLLPGG